MDKYVFVGDYGHFLAGYRIDAKSGEYSHTPVFGYESHSGIIRRLALSGLFLASGSSDEYIKFYDISKLREEFLLSPEEGVNALEFFGAQNIIAGGESGKLHFMVTDGKKNWEIAKTVKAHRAAISDIAVHPSSKAAISVATDSELILWDLTAGRSYKKSFGMKLPYVPDRIKWSKDESFIAIIARREVHVYDGKTLTPEFTHNFEADLRALHIKDNYLLCGGNINGIIVLDLKTKEKKCILSGISGRVREIEEFSADGTIVVATSDGKIYLFDLSEMNSPEIEPVYMFDTGLRVTAMALA